MKLLIVLIFSINLAFADGVDEPGFYDDFDENRTLEKYEFFAPPNYVHKRNLIECYPQESFKEQADVPEPPTALMILGAIIMFASLWRLK